MHRVKEALIDYWGERCPTYDRDCPKCQAWAEYDKLILTYELWTSTRASSNG